MATHHLDDDNLFLRCYNAGQIMIRRITNPGEVIAIYEEYKVVDTMNDELKVYDEIISGLKLRELEAELKKYKVYVNRQGYCYVVIYYDGGGSEIHRLNDVFNWSKYGVVPKITTIWSRCEMDTNAVVIDYEKKEKEFADVKLQLMKNDTTLHHLNDALELKAHDITEKEKYIVKKDEELREMAKCVETYEQELNEERRTKLKNIQELKDCKLQLERRERELSVLISLWERRLGAFGGSSSCNEGFIDKDKELHLYKTCLEENECELRKMSSRLCIEQKRVNDLKFAMNSVASYVHHVNASMHKEADHSLSYLAMSDREYVSIRQDRGDGSVADEMGATASVDITQQQSIHGK